MISNDLVINGEKYTLRFPNYTPSRRAREVLTLGGILSEGEMPQDLLKRVISTLFSVEAFFDTPPESTKEIAEEFSKYMVEGNLMLGTPTLTNAGRYEAALSSGAVAPVDLRTLNWSARELIRSYYKQNMGVGFNLTPYDDPIALLSWIEELSGQEEETGAYDRYIGNMGMLNISHPRVAEFIEVKRHKDLKHFNLSIDVTEEFMRRAEKGDTLMLSNGTGVNASDLFQHIAENAWYNGDPGLVYLERMNKDNPLSRMDEYVCTPPCAEMGLLEGETCHFGYLNLHSFVRKYGQIVEIDYSKLRSATQLLTRALDNAVEYSIARYPTSVSADVARKNRKIGIGVCGLADMLLDFSLPYDSQAARDLARDVLSFVNLTSKCASVDLANQRGSCQAMNFPLENRYLSGTFLEDKYARKPTGTVSSHEWERLGEQIRSTGRLRNLFTTALPPTGRASILLDVTSSIEPFFSIFASDGSIQENILGFLEQELRADKALLERIRHEAERVGSFQHLDSLPFHVRACLKTAKELSPNAHVQMVAAVAGLEGVIDESASKTVNLPYHATVEDVRSTFLASYHLGLKNISIYRDKTKPDQPVHL